MLLNHFVLRAPEVSDKHRAYLSLSSWQQPMRKKYTSYSSLFLIFLFFLSGPAWSADSSLSLDQKAVRTIFSGQEKMHFSITWSGGIKIGDLYLAVEHEKSGNGLTITAKVKDYGLFKFFYPVDDTFTTYIQGPQFLPYRYEVHQVEGGHVNVQRLTLYDQKNFQIFYKKNKNPEKKYTVTGTVYNEFSSFFITRALDLKTEKQEIVPTFVDEKRHNVAVKVLGFQTRKSLFGTVETIKVKPQMAFKGLYEKNGDTVFWLTKDACRVPVEIQSKIKVGSLVATLVEYSNATCALARW